MNSNDVARDLSVRPRVVPQALVGHPNALMGFSEQFAKTYRKPVEDIGRQIAGTLTLADVANFKSPFADMKVPNALMGFSEQFAKTYMNPVEDIGRQIAGTLTLADVANFKSPFADMKVPNALMGFSEQFAKTYMNPMEDIGRQIAGTLTLADVANFKSPLNVLLAESKISGLGSAWLTEFEDGGIDGLVSSFRTDFADNPSLAQEVEAIFEGIGVPEELLDQTADILNLTVPFGHDPAIRAGLQVVAVTSLFAVLLIIFLNNPVLGAVLSACGTPNVAESWKATGKAYDRLYGIEAGPKVRSTGRKHRTYGPLAKRSQRRSSRW